MRRGIVLSLALGTALVWGTLVTSKPAQAGHDRGGVVVVTPHVHHEPIAYRTNGLTVISDRHYIHEHVTVAPPGSTIVTPPYDDGYGHGYRSGGYGNGYSRGRYDGGYGYGGGYSGGYSSGRRG